MKKRTYPKEWDEKAPRLAALAKWINENTTLVAEMEKGYCNTDSKVAGTRFRRPGQGRTGTRLKVWTNAQHRRVAATIVTTDEERKLREKYGHSPLHDHNAAETYRYNSDVIFWLKLYLRDHPKVLRK